MCIRRRSKWALHCKGNRVLQTECSEFFSYSQERVESVIRRHQAQHQDQSWMRFAKGCSAELRAKRRERERQREDISWRPSFSHLSLCSSSSGYIFLLLLSSLVWVHFVCLPFPRYCTVHLPASLVKYACALCSSCSSCRWNYFLCS